MDRVFGVWRGIRESQSHPGVPGAYRARIGDRFRSTPNTSIRNMGSIEQVRIGRAVTLFDVELTCHKKGEIQIGHDVQMGPGVQVISASHISIGDYCVFQRDVCVRDTDAPGPGPQADTAMPARVTIGNDVWVGEGAIILKGVCLGNGCVVAPGSVVTQSFPAFSLVAGNPAVFVRKVINIHV